MDLLLRIKDASPEEISRGVAAAEGVLSWNHRSPGSGQRVRNRGLGYPRLPGGRRALGCSAHGGSNLVGRRRRRRRGVLRWLDGRQEARDVGDGTAGGPRDATRRQGDALAKLRLLTDAADGNGEFLDSDVGTLAWRVAADLEDNNGVERDLVGDVTIAFTALILSRFHPKEPIEPKRKTGHDAIDALEKATDEPTPR
ncbi:hypothetical protein [Mesorhizobium helmanticense]|uniref:hypothetical protein n=1 Tax=Mesorhizobium helmanticense TaxID=1776423 RepID=UPI0011B274ED|nr:hypothetical protein [Mesorhizobium helmanticense]